MATKAIERRLFEVDRKMELKLRLAAKKAAHPSRPEPMSLDFLPLPERELVERLLDRVREL